VKAEYWQKWDLIPHAAQKTQKSHLTFLPFRQTIDFETLNRFINGIET
jgi:hypothetical protein